MFTYCCILGASKESSFTSNSPFRYFATICGQNVEAQSSAPVYILNPSSPKTVRSPGRGNQSRDVQASRLEDFFSVICPPRLSEHMLAPIWNVLDLSTIVLVGLEHHVLMLLSYILKSTIYFMYAWTTPLFHPFTDVAQ